MRHDHARQEQDSISRRSSTVVEINREGFLSLFCAGSKTLFLLSDRFYASIRLRGKYISILCCLIKSYASKQKKPICQTQFLASGMQSSERRMRFSIAFNPCSICPSLCISHAYICISQQKQFGQGYNAILIYTLRRLMEVMT